MGGFNIEPEQYRKLRQLAEKDRRIVELEEQLKGPDGFETWKDAAVHERTLRVAADKCIDELEEEIKSMKSGKYLYTLYENNRKFFTNAIRDEYICPSRLADEFNGRIVEPPYRGYIVTGVSYLGPLNKENK